MKEQTVFFGASAYVLPIISYLKETYDLLLVVTTELKKTDAVPSFCINNTIPFYSVTQVKDPLLCKKLIADKASFAVVTYFGAIIPQPIIDLYPKGIINIHPSLLPKYRGTTPGQSAILNGDTTTGVSIMLIDSQVDHGPLLAQQSEKLFDTDTAASFYTRIFSKGTILLSETLPSYLLGTTTLLPQDHTQATYTKTLTRKDGYIDSTGIIDKHMFYRKVRAYYPWPGTWTTCTVPQTKLDRKIIKFLPSTDISSPFLIQVEGKKPMTLKDFRNGYPEAKNWLQQFVR